LRAAERGEARNKKIADIFKEAGIIEKYGSGISRVSEAPQKGTDLFGIGGGDTGFHSTGADYYPS